MTLTRRSSMTWLACLVAVAAGATLILTLQLVPPTDAISATRRTISEYALSEAKWVFDVAVGLIALGSVAGFATLRLRGALPAATAVFGTLWTIGLVVIVAFPKNDWAIGPSASGTVHRFASVVTFVCLPLAVLFAARAAFPAAPRRRLLARLLAVASLGWFGIILGAIAVAAGTGARWWLLIPLGLVERGMALTELLALLALVAPVRSPAPLVTPLATHPSKVAAGGTGT
ncbi:DUF998 domain-containing protein [Amycolatopsis sp. NPDC058986]|uniref:DUF998 domain-containing protein n=1 Tax=unclassified Amycolatopsis TaxID=2618356 RepID=UPI00366FF8C3